MEVVALEDRPNAKPCAAGGKQLEAAHVALDRAAAALHLTISPTSPAGAGGPKRDRGRPGLRGAMAAYHADDTLVVTKRNRLARSLPDVRDIVAELTAREVNLSLDGVGARPH